MPPGRLDEPVIPDRPHLVPADVDRPPGLRMGAGQRPAVDRMMGLELQFVHDEVEVRKRVHEGFSDPSDRIAPDRRLVAVDGEGSGVGKKGRDARGVLAAPRCGVIRSMG